MRRKRSFDHLVIGDTIVAMNRVIRIAIFCALAVLVALMAAGRMATGSANQSVGAPPSDLPVETSTLVAEDGQNVKAWALNGETNRGVVLLLHGIRSDRRSLITRARLLFQAGYSVLMIDLQAHGESAGDRITFGYLEARSVVAAIKYAKAKWPKDRLAIIGLSLGGAAAIFAAKHQRADAYVLEAVYSSLREATENRLRLRFGGFGPLLAPLLLWQTPLQLGFHADDLAPADQINQLGAPVLIIAGGKDERTTLGNTQSLFSKANHPKTLWVIPNAVHQDFLRYSKDEYSKRVLSFLKKSLGG